MDKDIKKIKRELKLLGTRTHLWRAGRLFLWRAGRLHAFHIRENAWFARLAAKKMGFDSVAIVLGKTIYLHNISKKDFLQDEKLLKHELCHVRQYQQHGYISFIVKYLLESIRKGYYNNKFEVEAREAEEKD